MTTLRTPFILEHTARVTYRRAKEGATTPEVAEEAVRLWLEPLRPSLTPRQMMLHVSIVRRALADNWSFDGLSDYLLG